MTDPTDDAQVPTDEPSPSEPPADAPAATEPGVVHDVPEGGDDDAVGHLADQRRRRRWFGRGGVDPTAEHGAPRSDPGGHVVTGHDTAAHRDTPAQPATDDATGDTPVDESVQAADDRPHDATSETPDDTATDHDDTPDDTPDETAANHDATSETPDEVAPGDDAGSSSTRIDSGRATAAEPVAAPADGAGPLVTGILAAEARARVETDRRRRRLVGGGVLGLLVVTATVITMTVSQTIANQRARDEAAVAGARAELATTVIDIAEQHESPGSAIATDTDRLIAAMEEHLVLSDRPDNVIAADAKTALERLMAAAEQLAALGDFDAPTVDPVLDPERALTVLQQLEALRAEGRALAEETAAATTEAQSWLVAVQDVIDALADHAAVVEAEVATSDVDELAALWEGERPTLQALSTVARRARAVPGLAAWADAHIAYTRDSLAWIDEAVALLEDGEVDTYNQRYAATVDVSDPFGFSAAITAATQRALESPALTDLTAVTGRAAIVLDAVTTLEQAVADELGDEEA